VGTTTTIRETFVGAMSPTILWVIFAVTFIIFIVVSVALLYHWKNYNVDQGSAKKISRFYFLVSALFLVVMFMAAISYSK